MKFSTPLFLVTLALGGVSFAAETGVSSELERTASTTPDEKREYATSAQQEMEDAVEKLGKMLEAADGDSESAGKKCIRDALTSARTLLQTTKKAEKDMVDALMEGSMERADHEYRKIAVGLTKSRQVLSDGERCAYGDDVQPGETSVKWTGGLTEGSDDTKALTLDAFDLGFDPPDVSPF